MFSLNQISHFFSDCAKVCLLANLIILFFRYWQLPTELQMLRFFLVLDLATEIIVWWTSERGMHNLPFLHLHTVLEFVSLSLFYKAVYHSKAELQHYFWPFVSGMCVLLIANSIFFEPINGFNSNAKTLLQIVLIACAVYYFFDAFGKTDFSQPNHQAISLVNIGIFVYNSGTLFIFMFAKILNKSKLSYESQLGFWVFNSFLFLIFQLLVLAGLWKAAFRKTK